MSITPAPQHGGADFRTTHWSAVLAAGTNAPAGHAALAELCQTYWYPLYAFVRRRGYDAHEAQDLTQEFLTRLIERGSLQFVAPEKGRFRSFLLVALKNFLTNEWARSQRQKRGGGQQIVSLEAELRYNAEPADHASPELIFDRTWAATLLDRVLLLLERDYSQSGRADLFAEVKPLLCGEEPLSTYREIAERHGISEGAVKMTVLRLRQRYATLLRAEIAQTVDTPEAVEQEIRDLLAIASGK